MESAITLLDNLIRVLGLTSIDAMDPRAPTFLPNSVPDLGRPPPNGARDHSPQSTHNAGMIGLPGTPPTCPPVPASAVKYQAVALPTPFDKWRSPADQLHLRDDLGVVALAGCPCRALSLASSPEVLRSTPAWGAMPRWAPNATWAEIRREEARRLVWSAVVMLGSDANTRQAGGISQLDLHVTKAENVSVVDLFIAMASQRMPPPFDVGPLISPTARSPIFR